MLIAGVGVYSRGLGFVKVCRSIKDDGIVTRVLLLGVRVYQVKIIGECIKVLSTLLPYLSYILE